jgi:FdhD protein
VAEIAAAVRPLRPVAPAFTLDAAGARRALAALPAHQPMNRVNRSVHAAAWCEPTGRVVLCREDVGRHNALDKVIGALVRGGADLGAGFVVMTSRCSFELVQKVATVGIPHLVTVSAPTALALRLAKEAGVGVAALSGDGVVVFG